MPDSHSAPFDTVDAASKVSILSLLPSVTAYLESKGGDENAALRAAVITFVERSAMAMAFHAESQEKDSGPITDGLKWQQIGSWDAACRGQVSRTINADSLISLGQLLPSALRFQTDSAEGAAVTTAFLEGGARAQASFPQSPPMTIGAHIAGSEASLWRMMNGTGAEGHPQTSELTGEDELPAPNHPFRIDAASLLRISRAAADSHRAGGEIPRDRLNRRTPTRSSSHTQLRTTGRSSRTRPSDSPATSQSFQSDARSLLRANRAAITSAAQRRQVNSRSTSSGAELPSSASRPRVDLRAQTTGSAGGIDPGSLRARTRSTQGFLPESSRTRAPTTSTRLHRPAPRELTEAEVTMYTEGAEYIQRELLQFLMEASSRHDIADISHRLKTAALTRDDKLESILSISEAGSFTVPSDGPLREELDAFLADPISVFRQNSGSRPDV